MALMGRRRFISPFTRVKAWWLGIGDAELLARYGERGIFRTIWMEWRGTLVCLACSAVVIINHVQSNNANEILDNIELNRQRYYKRDFTPEYVRNAPQAVYDGPKGYVYRDEASGLMLNADHKWVSDLSREERRGRIEAADVTPEMVEAAKKLLRSSQYE
ncbi:hypothetical protein TcG_03695 [Trypanosoma cruzi]|uniref:Uncharacterized protein n=2 Tax=Trypanosoma cruzi TaxID=5693 RepID=V5DEI9_TRYCR|nr:hypothetical protein TCDM_14360 [Trypanosoma cruzi Dm28c]KAF8283468.1 hypothetical protein TcBrA4_0055300 [Trypanosoma cruzi]PBJ69341.1 hypothetical protein BCY84_19908 [Trypanosoma cruzi cruzi]PWU92329.1 hypothetical protein C4B63_38g48 [Trypanosoma cruzi]RNF20448.1 hypothetical protein TcG_03695 [Trypanosoma cruzi]